MKLGGVVRAEGWHNWHKPEVEPTARYAEFHNTGPGARPDARVKWAEQLTAAEAERFTKEKVLRGNDDWQP